MTCWPPRWPSSRPGCARIVARWRRAGYAATGPLGPGPAWCWLTPAGMTACGLPYPAARPPLARLEHLRAVLAARLWFTASPAWDQHQAWWQSERRIRRKGPFAGTHRPDAEIWWPSLRASPYAGQIWAIEIELTAKHAARIAQIMDELTAPAGYARVLYLTAPAARGVVARTAGALPLGRPVRLTVWDLPPAAYWPGQQETNTGIHRKIALRSPRDSRDNRLAMTAEMTGENSNAVPGQRKQARKWPPYDDGARIISYNVNEEGRPSGIKIRFKIRVVSGREAAAVDRQQADAIREYLRWVRQYRQSRNSAPGDTPSGPPDQRRSG